MNNPRVYPTLAPDIVAGDDIIWVDRLCAVMECEPTRGGVYLHVREYENGAHHRLHWRDDERVRRVADE